MPWMQSRKKIIFHSDKLFYESVYPKGNRDLAEDLCTEMFNTVLFNTGKNLYNTDKWLSIIIHKMVHHATIKNHVFLEHSVSWGNVHDITFKIESMELYTEYNLVL